MKDLRTSLQSAMYNYQDNYDRYEFLGDCVLKMLSTVQVFMDFPEADENILNMKRTQIINNTFLR